MIRALTKSTGAESQTGGRKNHRSINPPNCKEPHTHVQEPVYENDCCGGPLAFEIHAFPGLHGNGDAVAGGRPGGWPKQSGCAEGGVRESAGGGAAAGVVALD